MTNHDPNRHSIVDVTNEPVYKRMEREIQTYKETLERKTAYVTRLEEQSEKRRAEFGVYYILVLSVFTIACSFAYFVYQHALAVV